MLEPDANAEAIASTIRDLYNRKFTTARAAALLKHFKRYSANDVLWAIQQHRIDDPDLTLPNWNQIGVLLLTVGRNVKGYKPTGDDYDPIRMQLHSVHRMLADANKFIPEWLNELLAVDAQAPHGEACRLWFIFAFDPIGAPYFVRGRSRRERYPEIHKAGLDRCKKRCKQLPVVGPQTERQKLEWLSQIADEEASLKHVVQSQDAFDVVEQIAAQPSSEPVSIDTPEDGSHETLF